MIDLDELQKNAIKYKPSFKAWYKKNKKKLEKMDAEVQTLHEEVMSQIDCLSCAGCCKGLGPAVYDKDIERIAKTLRLKPSEVVDQYLKIDEDGDYVFQSIPCPFLMSDNYCSIYEARPKACREYPHTDRKRFYQIYNLTVKNTETCPVAFQVMKKLINT
ncbi:YkgJ family cysteine cluster protein [Bacteroidales bacterium OttesenSCG-928-M11]|nr:YkgJ family cysteine cluster protein [Bacteroidales bacterium OttesenSCG-928-M11]